jgi:peptidyl-prolyl cis-trans isomerase SurA
LQVEDFFPGHLRLACFTFLGGALLFPISGCHPAPPADVVATVNGKNIQRSELDRKFQIWKMTQGENPQDPSPEQADIARLALLRQMIDEEILQQRAVRLNVAASDEDVNAALTEKKLPYTQEEFDAQLKQHNETLDDFKRDLRHSLTESKLLNKEIDSKINITDAEIGNYYKAHQADFNFIEPQYHLAIIAVRNGPAPQATNLQNNKASSPADAKDKIQLLYKKLESGEDFGSVALNYSEGNTASNQGDLGFVQESALQARPDVFNAIGKLKPGQYTEVIPDFDPASHKVAGYAIYKLISKEAAGQRNLTNVQVQQAIRQSLRDGHGQLLRDAYFEMLRDDAKVHNYLADQILNAGVK